MQKGSIPYSCTKAGRNTLTISNDTGSGSVRMEGRRREIDWHAIDIFGDAATWLLRLLPASPSETALR